MSRDTRSQPWPVRKEHSDHMRLRQQQNRARSFENPNENWMAAKLAATPYRWTRQALWGFRVFDFWCHQLGIAVEVDGPEHDAAHESTRDALDMERSGILVLRCDNRDEVAAARVVETILEAETWRQRRDRLGIRKGGNRRATRSVDNSGAGPDLEQQVLL